MIEPGHQMGHLCAHPEKDFASQVLHRLEKSPVDETIADLPTHTIFAYSVRSFKAQVHQYANLKFNTPETLLFLFCRK